MLAKCKGAAHEPCHIDVAATNHMQIFSTYSPSKFIQDLLNEHLLADQKLKVPLEVMTGNGLVGMRGAVADKKKKKGGKLGNGEKNVPIQWEMGTLKLEWDEQEWKDLELSGELGVAQALTAMETGMMTDRLRVTGTGTGSFGAEGCLLSSDALRAMQVYQRAMCPSVNGPDQDIVARDLRRLVQTVGVYDALSEVLHTCNT